MLKNHNGENKKLTFFRRNTDVQRKNDLSNKLQVIFSSHLHCKTPIIKPFEKANLKKILIKSNLLKEN